MEDPEHIPGPLCEALYCAQCGHPAVWRPGGLIPHADPVQDGDGGHPVDPEWRARLAVTA